MYHSDGPPCILGRYRLLGRLMGKGNYARVEEAVHLDVDNAHVAVKMIDTHTVKDPYVLRHLEREAKVLQQLKHPNIMAIFEVLRTGSFYCMVTEPLYGGELCTHVNRQPRGHLDEATTLVFGAQLISAVAHMHALQVVHRDLKTKNIMLSKRGDHVKIVDFGLGRTWSRTRPLLTHCGSPGYAAPEIYQRDSLTRRPYGPEVDLWSLGVVLYYMAVGRMPFPPCRDKGRTAEERRRRLVAMISKGATDHHVKLMGHFSPEFRDLVQGLLTASVPRRMTLQQAIQHPWVANRLRARQLLNITYRLSSQERALVLAKVAILMKSTVQSIEAQWRQNRLGEVAAMCNILAHKQLSAYHAAWALRPVSPKRPGLMGAAGAASQPYRAKQADRQPLACRAGPSSEADDNEALVDQPPSSAYEGGEDDRQVSATSVTSLCSELANALPPPPRPLALLHAPLEHDDEDLDEHGDDGEDSDDDSSAGSATVVEATLEGGEELEGTTPTAETVQATQAAVEAEDTVEDSKAADTAGSDAKGRDTGMAKIDAYIVGCLLDDADGQEQLQPLPETRVMFYTETILDNIHAATATAPASAKLKEACTATVGTNSTAPAGALPIKSALASQTGLSAKTRKAVSFSIITTAQSADSVVLEQRRETGVQANLGNPYRHTVSATAGAGTLPQPDIQTSDAELLQQRPSKDVQTGEPVVVQSSTPQNCEGNSDLADGTSLPESDVCRGNSQTLKEMTEVVDQCSKPSKQDIKFDNKANAAKFFNTVPLSRKVSPEPKKNIYEGRRWPFRSPRLVYQRMKSQSKLSVAYLLDSQEHLVNITGKRGLSGAAVLPTGPTHSTMLPAHQEESGEEDALATHITSNAIQTRGNSSQRGKSTSKPTDSETNSAMNTSESRAHDDDKINQDSHNTKGPLHTVAEMVRTRLGAVKEKNTEKQQERAEPKARPKEKKSSATRYRRFFPNRYRVDLALVMTLERSRKLLLPSIHSPRTPPKQEK
ncbi:serine/threonine-protein kinase MARK1-like [Thrips palmi]|uniref:Serine/threonine-protein kinase MARK1-like n=1 Tax=Thrips palmi TaxID=161013 RepID=A0A6P8YUV0_THRPL|nr:serine/threonine-protein kinase MARK1-like [Thrips palmi]